MSLETGRKKSFRQAIKSKQKIPYKLPRIDTQAAENYFKKLPDIIHRKYASSKNLVFNSKTCQINPAQDENKQAFMKEIRKKYSKKTLKFLKTQTAQAVPKVTFGQNKQSTIQIQKGQLRKYGSCNKFASIPSISQNIVSNDESLIQDYVGSQNSIKSMNLIQEKSQKMKKPKLDRVPLKKIVKSNLSKTINPRKNSNENSIQIQNEPEQKQKHFRKFRVNRDHIEAKTKIWVKNPFERLAQKQQHRILQQNFQNNQSENQLSKIFEDIHNQSKISMNGQIQISQLISLMH